jgi:Flp pilus assembly protein TadG
MAPDANAMRKPWQRLRERAVALANDRSGLAATEFAFIVPVMLVLFFGTVEISNGVAAYRKVSIMAHTLSDLTSQSTSVQDSDLSNFFCAAAGVMTPYVNGPCPVPGIQQTITELWINPSLQARVQWSSGSTPLSAGTIVTIPSGLAVANTYVIYSQVNFLYTPAVGFVMNKSGVNLSDFAFTRPRLSQCVLYDPAAPNTPCPQT